MSDEKKTKKERTKVMVQYLTSKDPKSKDSINKKIKREMLRLDVKFQYLRVGGDWFPSHEYIGNEPGINSGRETIRHYTNAIKALGVLGAEYETYMEANKSQIIDILGNSDDVNDLFKYDDIEAIRVAYKRIHRSHNKKTKRNPARIVLSRIKPEQYAYYKLVEVYEMLSVLVNTETEKTLKKKHDDRIRVNPDYAVRRAQETLLDKASSWQELAAALIVVTGRRPTEILKTGIFKKIDKDNLMFDGQLKTRDRSIHEDVGPFPIPVFVSKKCPINVVIEAVDRVRASVSAIGLAYPDILGADVESTIGDPKHGIGDIAHNRAVTHYSNRPINDVFSKWMGTDGITCKAFRSVYSMLAYEKNKKNLPEATSENSYATDILGYTPDVFGAERTYKQIELSRDIEIAEMPKVDKKDIDAALVKLLEEKTEDVRANKRAKATYDLHDKLIELAKAGHITMENMTPGRLSRVQVGVKRINIDTIRGYMKRIGLKNYEKKDKK